MWRELLKVKLSMKRILTVRAVDGAFLKLNGKSEQGYSAGSADPCRGRDFAVAVVRSIIIIETILSISFSEPIRGFVLGYSNTTFGVRRNFASRLSLFGRSDYGAACARLVFVSVCL